MNKDTLKNITSKRLFLPVVCLLAVLLANVIKTPDFFKITLENGVLSGYIIITDNRTFLFFFMHICICAKQNLALHK